MIPTITPHLSFPPQLLDTPLIFAVCTSFLFVPEDAIILQVLFGDKTKKMSVSPRFRATAVALAKGAS